MDPYVKLAQEAVEEFIRNKKALKAPSDLPADFSRKENGVFVTIFNKKLRLNDPNKGLRGCIGTYSPVQKNLGKEIIENAISACSKDSRFDPITESELEDLNYEVSVLSKPQPVKDITKLDPKTHGIIVRSLDGRSGLLLPDLEGVEKIEQQISIACQKAGINPSSDEIQLFCFKVDKHR